MNATEAVRLTQIVAALCPAMKLDAMTAQAWAIVLDETPYADAETAVRTIYKQQGSDAEWVRKIEADDILRQVKRIRAERIAKVADAVPPAGLTQAEERAWFRDLFRRTAEGEVVDVSRTRGELVHRDIRALMAGEQEGAA